MNNRTLRPLLNLAPIFDHQGTPSFRDRLPLPLVERPDLVDYSIGLPKGTPQRYYTLGTCTIIVTHDGGAYGWHLSIAHPSRYPKWDEIAEARARVLPDVETMAMILPLEKDWINIHENCFQLIEIPKPDTTRVS